MKRKRRHPAGPSHRDRLRLIADLKLREPTLSYTELSERTGIPVGTIKSDMHRLGLNGNSSNPNQPASTTGNSPPATGLQPAPQALARPPEPSRRPSLDWTDTMDRLGKIASGIVGQLISGKVRTKCKTCGSDVEVEVLQSSREAQGWANTFGRLFRDKVMAERITFLLDSQGRTAIVEMPATLTRPALLEALRREDCGPDCLLCGRPKAQPLPAPNDIGEV